MRAGRGWERRVHVPPDEQLASSPDVGDRDRVRHGYDHRLRPPLKDRRRTVGRATRCCGVDRGRQLTRPPVSGSVACLHRPANRGRRVPGHGRPPRERPEVEAAPAGTLGRNETSGSLLAHDTDPAYPARYGRQGAASASAVGRDGGEGRPRQEGRPADPPAYVWLTASERHAERYARSIPAASTLAIARGFGEASGSQSRLSASWVVSRDERGRDVEPHVTIVTRLEKRARRPGEVTECNCER